MNPYVMHRDGDITRRDDQKFVGYIDRRQASPSEPKRWIAECFFPIVTECHTTASGATRGSAVQALWEHIERDHA